MTDNDAFRHAMTRLAVDPDFAAQLDGDVDEVSRRLGLTPEQVAELRRLRVESATGVGPATLDARLSKSSLFFGNAAHALAHHDVPVDHVSHDAGVLDTPAVDVSGSLGEPSFGDEGSLLGDLGGFGDAGQPGGESGDLGGFGSFGDDGAGLGEHGPGGFGGGFGDGFGDGPGGGAEGFGDGFGGGGDGGFGDGFGAHGGGVGGTGGHGDGFGGSGGGAGDFGHGGLYDRGEDGGGDSGGGSDGGGGGGEGGESGGGSQENERRPSGGGTGGGEGGGEGGDSGGGAGDGDGGRGGGREGVAAPVGDGGRSGVFRPGLDRLGGSGLHTAGPGHEAAGGTFLSGS